MIIRIEIFGNLASFEDAEGYYLLDSRCEPVASFTYGGKEEMYIIELTESEFAGRVFEDDESNYLYALIGGIFYRIESTVEVCHALSF